MSRMSEWFRLPRLLPTFSALLLLSVLSVITGSCGSDAYDTGQGQLSGLRADFAEAATNASSLIVSVETDDGEELPLTGAVEAAWAERPDTVYRVLLYYEKETSADGTAYARPISLQQVLVPPIVGAGNVDGEIMTDPVDFDTSWKSRNGKYLNLGLYLKIGTTDGDYGTQSIGLICDSVVVRADGTRRVALCLYHDQNGVPEYYSAETYVSIPVAALPIQPAEGDEVSIDINTYDGVVTRMFSL